MKLHAPAIPENSRQPAAQNTGQAATFQLNDNRPVQRHAFMQQPPVLQKPMLNNSTAPIQGKWLTITYLNQWGKAESVVGLDSTKLTINQLKGLRDSQFVGQSGKLEVIEALQNKETLEHTSFGAVPGPEGAKFAHKRVDPYGLQEDIFNKTEMPELEDTEVIADSGTVYFKKNKQIANGSFKYGIKGSTGILHLVPKDTGNYRHSSTVKSAPVLSAGNVWISRGVIVKIDNDSGHYKPGRAHFVNGMRQLYHAGYLVPGSFVFGYRGEDSQYTDLNTSQSANWLLNDPKIQPPKKSNSTPVFYSDEVL